MAVLAGIQELVPWLKQWHNDLDPQYGVGMGNYFDDFVQEECRALGLTPDHLPTWNPPTRISRRERLKKS